MSGARKSNLNGRKAYENAMGRQLLKANKTAFKLLPITILSYSNIIKMKLIHRNRMLSWPLEH